MIERSYFVVTLGRLLSPISTKPSHWQENEVTYRQETNNGNSDEKARESCGSLSIAIMSVYFYAVF